MVPILTQEKGTMTTTSRSRWAAIGAAIAVTLGAGGIGITHATSDSGDGPVSAFFPIEPCRLAENAAITADTSITLNGSGMTGGCDLPAGITGLAANVTAVNATQQTNLRFYAQGDAVPETANLNPTPGAPPTPNAVNIPLNVANGQFSVYNRFGSVGVFIDILGYYDDHTHDDRYYTETEVDAAIADVDADVAAVDAAKLDSEDVLYAMVNSDGSIGRQSGGISVSHSAGSTYFVTFPRDVTTCSWSATLGGDGVLDATVSQLANQGIAAAQGNDAFAVDPDEILVYVWEQDTGTLEDGEFTLQVICP
jgi:hypothetical protein